MIDENEAPAGFKAAPVTNDCAGCAFKTGKHASMCVDNACTACARADSESVIFVEKETP